MRQLDSLSKILREREEYSPFSSKRTHAHDSATSAAATAGNSAKKLIVRIKDNKSILNNNNNVLNTETILSHPLTFKQLSNVELNSLYNIAGYIIKSISKNCKICTECLLSVGSKNAYSSTFSKLVELKCYTKNSLYFVNKSTFRIFIKLEQMFIYYSKYFLNIENTNIKAFLTAKFKEVPADHILNCHNLYSKIVRRFIVLRLHIHQRKYTFNKGRYDSKSMAMHTIFS